MMNLCKYNIYIGGGDGTGTTKSLTPCKCAKGGAHVFILPDTNAPYYEKMGLFENTLIEWTAEQLCDKNKITLDIGAHTGTYGISLANYSKRVVCFEPQRATFYALCGSVALSGLSHKVLCHQVALGSAPGEVELNIISPDGGGSFIVQPDRGDGGNSPSANVLQTEMVKMRTLDSFNLDNIGFIKIDVENSELAVLQGAHKTIQRCSPKPKILFESNHPSNMDGPLFEFIKSMGYTIYPINHYSNMFLAA
jgi:FkbM family methyltransferase